MQDHDDGHGEGDEVHEVDGGLEDDCVGELDAAGVAGRENGGGIGDWVDGTDERAEGQGALLAYCCEVAECHDGLCGMWCVLYMGWKCVCG